MLINTPQMYPKYTPYTMHATHTTTHTTHTTTTTRLSNMRCVQFTATRAPFLRFRHSVQAAVCKKIYQAPVERVTEQQPLHKRMAMLALATVAAAALASPLPASADELVQTVPPNQLMSAAKPIPQQQVNKGKVWLIFVLGAASLFGAAVVLENNSTFFPAISRANRAMSITRRQEDKQEAMDDAYLRSLEAGAGVPPLPPQLNDPSYFPSSTTSTTTTSTASVDVDDVTDAETARLTAAVQAGLAQASQRVAANASEIAPPAIAPPAVSLEASANNETATAEYPAQLQAEGVGASRSAPSSSSSSSSSSITPSNSSTTSTASSTSSSTSGYVVVTEQDPEALAGATVLQQVQSIATAGVQQSRVAVKQLQKGLEAAKSGGDQSSQT